MIKITGESKEKDCKISIETTFEKLSSMYDTGIPNSYVGYYKELPYRRYSNIIVESTDETNFDRLFLTASRCAKYLKHLFLCLHKLLLQWAISCVIIN